MSEKEDTFNNSSVSTVFDKQFTKMTNLINILKEEKNMIILEMNEAITESNK